MHTFALRQRLTHSATLSALRHRNFRVYMFGQAVSIAGSWMQVTAQGWLIYNLTGSELWLGIVACAAGIPALLVAPFTGVVLDRVPKKYALIFSNCVLMLQAILMAYLVISNTVQVWQIVALSLLLGLGNALDSPSRHAIIADLVGHEDLSSGVAMNALMFNSSRIFGPAVAGFMLTNFGPGLCFAVNAISFMAILPILFWLPMSNQQRATGKVQPLAQLREGLAFIKSHPLIRPLLLMAVVGAFFTGNIGGMFPAFAAEALQSPKAGYAAIATALGFGATLAALLTQPICRRYGRGRVVMIAMVLVLLSVGGATRMTTVPLAVIGFGLYGFTVVLQFVNYNTLVQNIVPDAYRGRVMSLYTGAFFGVSPFGALLLGFISAGWGEPTATGHLTGIGTPNAMALYALLGGGLSLLIAVRSGRIWTLR